MRSIDEGQARLWDIALKVVAGVAAATAWVWSVHQYRDSQREQAKTLALQVQAQRLQAQQPFLSKQLEVYFQLSEAAARVAESKTKKDKERALHAFDVVANGALKLVSADDVNTAAWEFFDCIHNQNCPTGDEVHYARNVARACRKSTGNYWVIPLPELTEHPRMQN